MQRSIRIILGLLIASGSIAALSSAQDSGASRPPEKPSAPVPAPAVPSVTDQSLTLPAEPSAGEWQLDFEAGDLRLYIDPQTAEAFWYLTYRVVNRTGLDRWWGPKFELLDDHGRLRRSGKDIPVTTIKRIEALIGNKLLEDQYQVLGEIRQGEAHAKESFVVWNAQPLDATELHLFIRGMSSEIRKIPHPSGTGAPILMHKTMKRDYRVSGNPRANGSTPVVCEQTEWLLR